MFDGRLVPCLHLWYKHLLLERASVTTAQAHTCISPLGRRISMEWCIWWLQQHGGQQQRGQLYLVLVVARLVAAALVRAIQRGSEAAERSFGDHVMRRPAVLVACDPSTVQWVVFVAIFMVEDAWRLYPYVRDALRTHITRTYAVAVAALPLC